MAVDTVGTASSTRPKQVAGSGGEGRRGGEQQVRVTLQCYINEKH